MKSRNPHISECTTSKYLAFLLEKCLERLSPIRIVVNYFPLDWLLLTTTVQLHSVSSSSHVACNLCLLLLFVISLLWLSVCLSSTTCYQGSLSPISHCLRPTGLTSAFVSQHHGVLHLQPRAVHHRSRSLCQHLGFGEAELSCEVQFWVSLGTCWLSLLLDLSLSLIQSLSPSWSKTDHPYLVQTQTLPLSL